MGIRLYCADCGKPVSSELPSHETADSFFSGKAFCTPCFEKRLQRIEALEAALKIEEAALDAPDFDEWRRR